MKKYLPLLLAILLGNLSSTPLLAADPAHPSLVWVKKHPNPVAKIPSPKLGYEGSFGYDPANKILIRHGGHNQGGGGEQNAETWTYNLEKDIWKLEQPNDAPPGVCCAQQNVFHDALGKFIRFPAFSNSHGWQSVREVALKNTSVWTYDYPNNTWTNMRPMPEPQLHPLRGAAYDPDHEVVVIHGGEGAKHSTVVYDLYSNTWHWMNPKNAPPTDLSQPGFTYDPVNKVFVLFGSQFKSDPRTWIYNLPKNEWKVLKTEGEPPFDKSSPILAADSRNGIVLASIQGKDGLETWALDVAKATWKKLDVKWEGENQDKSMNGNRNRVLLYLPGRNLFMMEVCTSKEQQIWTFRYAEAPEPLPKPHAFKLEVLENNKGIYLTWFPPTDKMRWSYHIYRGVGERPWEVKWELKTKSKYDGPYLIEKGKTEKNIWYRIHAVGKDGKEGPSSKLARTQLPAAPEFTVSVLESKKVQLDFGGGRFHVERAEVLVYSTDQVQSIKKRLPTSELAAGMIKQIGPFKRLTTKPVNLRTFVDTDINLEAGQGKPSEKPLYNRELRKDQIEADGKPYKFAAYAYRLIAVNPQGEESGPSPVVLTIPSSPQHVFAKEDGQTATHLKWKASTEKNLKGYLVYRHDGRFNNSQIVCLTPTPIKETTFVDKDSGTATRRYEIVAVDALGQEGIPSQPVWSRREWQSFYVPYAKLWHQ